MNGPFDAQAVCLETPRLILRPWRESDLEDLYAYARIDGVGQMAGWKPHASIGESAQILQIFLRENKTLALEERASGKVIGSLGMEEVRNLDASFDALQGREVGYVLRKSCWGRGLMPEAVAAIIEYSFDRLRYDFLTCCHFQWNTQSRRVIEKSGFQFYKNISYETRMGNRESSKLYVLYNPYVTR